MIDNSLVTFRIAEGNPGTLSFMAAAYAARPGTAEVAFRRMRNNGITGSKLYMLWNDCCDRNTDMSLKIMTERGIDEIKAHINYEEGRGIPFKEEK